MTLRVIDARTGRERKPTSEEIAAWEAAKQQQQDPDPLSLSLTKRQINAALILAGHTDPDTFIETAITAIEDATARALALNDWRYAPYYDRSHPLFNNLAMLTATGMTSQDIDALWLLAIDQPK